MSLSVFKTERVSRCEFKVLLINMCTDVCVLVIHESVLLFIFSYFGICTGFESNGLLNFSRKRRFLSESPVFYEILLSFLFPPFFSSFIISEIMFRIPRQKNKRKIKREENVQIYIFCFFTQNSLHRIDDNDSRISRIRVRNLSWLNSFYLEKQMYENIFFFKVKENC